MPRVRTFLLLCLIVLVSSPFAQAEGRDQKLEAEIEARLAASHPDLVATFHAATAAMDRNDPATAAKLYGEVLAKAPDFDPAVRRLGSCQNELGQRAEALANFKRAVSLRMDFANVFTYALGLSTTKDGRPSHEELRNALSMTNDMMDLPGAQPDEILLLRCQLLFQLEDMEAFHAATGEFVRRNPGNKWAHYFAAISAAIQEHWNAAESEIHKGQRLGLDDAIVTRFLNSGVHRQALLWRWGTGFAILVAAWIVGMGLMISLGVVLSKHTLANAEMTDAFGRVSPSEIRLRSLYRSLVNVAGLYYYVSLPIVLVLVVAVVALAVMLSLAAGWIPIKLLALLGVAAVLTIVAMVRSFFVKMDDTDPGRPLTRDEAPELWTLVEEVARDLNTRPVDEIRLTLGTDMAVYERGSRGEKARDRADRILLLGTGLLKGFQLDGFRSVLAHEYGHFSHRDTAGGEIALCVRRDMINFYLAMYKAGAATNLNLGFHFLRFYNFLFRRVSHGATRLQEILADRAAASLYGAPAFQSGLTHVIRRGIEFETGADKEVKKAVDELRPVRNLYEGTHCEEAEVEKAYEAAITRPTTDDDTHPGPQDRLRLARKVTATPRPARPGTVWDLFKDPAAITAEMMSEIEQNVNPQRRWDDPAKAFKENKAK